MKGVHDLRSMRRYIDFGSCGLTIDAACIDWMERACPVEGGLRHVDERVYRFETPRSHDRCSVHRFGTPRSHGRCRLHRFGRPWTHDRCSPASIWDAADSRLMSAASI